MPVVPRLRYLVCATPRSGSTLLCEALAATGVAGRPGEPFEALSDPSAARRLVRDYFGERPDPELAALLPAVPGTAPGPAVGGDGTFAAFLADVERRATTPNGVFGTKLMWEYLPDVLARARTVPGLVAPGADDRAVLAAAFPGARHVRVVRRDRAAQAVSLWKAVQTQVWRDGAAGDGPARGEAVFHRGAIAHLADRLAEHEAAWAAFLAGVEPEPLVVVYEELVADFRGTLARVLDHLGIEAPPAGLPGPPLRRQADERSARWRERFLAEA